MLDQLLDSPDDRVKLAAADKIIERVAPKNGQNHPKDFLPGDSNTAELSTDQLKDMVAQLEGELFNRATDVSAASNAANMTDDDANALKEMN